MFNFQSMKFDEIVTAFDWLGAPDRLGARVARRNFLPLHSSNCARTTNITGDRS
jgi:hypothetical protein